MTLDDEIREAAQAIVRASRDDDQEACPAGLVADCSSVDGHARQDAV